MYTSLRQAEDGMRAKLITHIQLLHRSTTYEALSPHQYARQRLGGYAKEKRTTQRKEGTSTHETLESCDVMTDISWQLIQHSPQPNVYS
jgi:hypothetical protein